MTLMIDPHGRVFLDNHEIKHVSSISIHNRVCSPMDAKIYMDMGAGLYLDVDAVEIDFELFQPKEEGE